MSHWISTTLAIQTHGNELFSIVIHAYFVCLKKGLKDTERKEGGAIMKTLMTFGWYSAYDS